MKSVDKLRELPVFGAVSISGDLNATNQLMVCATKEEVLEIADEIEAEIEERSMELPVDADGVPIRVGDKLEYRGLTFEAFSVAEDVVFRECDFNSGRYKVDVYDHSDVRHYNPRTLEDVLADVVTLCANTWKDDKSPFAFYDVSDVMASDNIREYADEIRELLGGDTE